MSTLRVVYHLARADFLERARRYSFLVMLGFVIWIGYLVNTGVIALTLDQYRGVFNSAWVGSLMTLVTTTLVSLAGFYLVKNAIIRDDTTGVGQIIATTPMSRPVYTVGKWLSNFAVLGCIVLVLAGAGVVMQLTKREAATLDLWALLAPLLLVALPAMGLVAALAVLFETVGWLRGGLGNVIVFFGWAAMIALVIAPAVGGRQQFPDPLGAGLFMPSMMAAAKAAFPAYSGGLTLGVIPKSALQTFVWPGVHWTAGILLVQAGWLVAGLGIALLAALPFDRFDPSRERRPARAARGAAQINAELAAVAAPPASRLTSGSLTAPTRRFNFIGLWLAELRLMLKGLRWWWYVIALGIIVGGLAAPLADSQKIVLPLAWLWPILVWSSLGNREARYRTGQFIFTGPGIVLRQLAAMLLAGVTVAVLVSAGTAVQLASARDWPGLLAWGAGALFIPSLALALGVWSGSSKLFEVIYVLLWYLGPFSGAAALDFAGATRQSSPLEFLALAVLLLVAAWLGRKIRL